MIAIAFAFGLYSYILFFLGLGGQLYPGVVHLFTYAFISVFILSQVKRLPALKKQVHKGIPILFQSKFLLLLVIIFSIQIAINLFGALGPEIAFDSLWYHLTIPKIFILNHKVSHIPGALLHYSDMPKLTEMIYMGALMIKDEILVKLIHFFFGLLSCVVLYKVSRRFLSSYFSFIAVCIFYSNLLVGWESITAFIDLSRAFYEIMGLYCLIEWGREGTNKWFLLSAIMVGFSIATKLVAVGTLGIFLILISYILYKAKKPLSTIVKKLVLFFVMSLLIPMPWFLFAYSNTGNPFYPLFSPQFKTVHESIFSLQMLHPFTVISTVWKLFVFGQDPISPIYIIVLPLWYLFYKVMKNKYDILFLYGLLSIGVWYVTSKVEGSRLFLSYLPIFSILTAAIYQNIVERKKIGKMLKYFLWGIFVCTLFSSIIYRGIANAKFIPYVLGIESKDRFLTEHLNFTFGDFYDTDGYFKKHIAASDRVLLLGFHNLYYVEFPFIDYSWVKKGDTFNFIAVQNGELPKRFQKAKHVYHNKLTKVDLYSTGGNIWQW